MNDPATSPTSIWTAGRLDSMSSATRSPSRTEFGSDGIVAAPRWDEYPYAGYPTLLAAGSNDRQSISDVGSQAQGALRSRVHHRHARGAGIGRNAPDHQCPRKRSPASAYVAQEHPRTKIRNVITRAAKLADNRTIEVEDLMLQTPGPDPPSQVLAMDAADPAGFRRPLPARPRAVSALRPLSPHKIAAQSAERDEMSRVIEQCGGRSSRAGSCSE